MPDCQSSAFAVRNPLFTRSPQLASWVLSGVVAFSLTVAAPVAAQVVPDESLGNERSTVTPDVPVGGATGDRIDGGAQRGGNLFHSFSEFNLEVGDRVYFANPDGVERILSRVTGGNPSEILGTLGVLGNADLFLLNPSGIFFGANAQLDVRGSFVASTADSFIFENGFQFSASRPEAPSLLTVSTPIGLQFGATPGTITSQANLRIFGDETLVFVGGDVAIDGGELRLDGPMELGSVAANSAVGLTATDQGYRTTYETVQEFRDIRLTNGAIVSASGRGARTIQLQGRQISIADGANVTVITDGDRSTGSLVINAADTVELAGTNSDGSPSGLFARAFGTENSANITVNTNRLSLREGAIVLATTAANASLATILINAANAVEVVGADQAIQFQSGLYGEAEGDNSTGRLTVNTPRLTVQDGGAIRLETAGNAGRLTVNTDRLLLQNGGQLLASLQGDRDSGRLTVNATAFVTVSGRSPQTNRASRIAAETPDQGNAGDILINTGALTLRDDAEIVSLTQGAGNAGNIQINADRLLVQNGGQLLASTQDRGNSGRLTVNATGAVIVSGTSPQSNRASRIASETRRTGNAGGLSIDTEGDVTIQENGQIQVIGDRSGNPSDLRISAANILLDQGLLTAETNSGVNANIQLRATNTINHRNGSIIQVDTINDNDRDDGNITIRADRLITRRDENSDIVMNPRPNDEREITINTDRIFGFQFVNQLTRFSDITDSNTVGNDGNGNGNGGNNGNNGGNNGNGDNDGNGSDRPLEDELSEFNRRVSDRALNSTDDDSELSSIAVSAAFVNDSEWVAQGCAWDDEEDLSSQFVVTGRGGLPTNPGAPLVPDTLWQDWQAPVPSASRATTLPHEESVAPANVPLVEAQSWIVDESGRVVLVAHQPTATPNFLGNRSTCRS